VERDTKNYNIGDFLVSSSFFNKEIHYGIIINKKDDLYYILTNNGEKIFELTNVNKFSQKIIFKK